MDRNNTYSGIFSAMTDKASGNDESIDALLQNIPGGIVMYEWDGQQLKTLYISDHYAKQYGSSLVSEGANDGGPDFMRVHPDDLADYQAAVVNAINTTQILEYTYRIWNDEANCYLWTKLNATSKRLPDGKSIIYALYTDVTAEIEAKLEAEKNHETLKASIAVSNQYCFELDPTTDYMICPPEQAKFFGLPADYINFPESLFEAGGILEEARPVADELMEKLHRGVPEAECELLMYTKGVYLWYRFCFRAWDDPSKGYPIYLCSFANINAQKIAEEKYTQQMEVISKSANDALLVSKINITKNICFFGKSNSAIINDIWEYGQGKLDESLRRTGKYIPDASEREQFQRTFSLEKLMQSFKQGITHTSMQYRLMKEKGYVEWIETTIDLVENPSSFDIEGYLSAKSINSKKIEEMILQKVIERDYYVVIYFDRYREDYMMFDNQSQQYFAKQKEVYTKGIELVLSRASKEEKSRLKKKLTKEIIIQKLSENKEYSLFYEGSDYHKRYEVIFSNVQGDDRLIIGVLRDVTDERLLEKLTYESEHDALTGLYNRKKVFEKCNALMEEKPDVPMCMIHFDVQKFRLYNSFFGDYEGDRLLKHIAVTIEEVCSRYKNSVFGRIEADQFLVCILSGQGNDIVLLRDQIRRAFIVYRSDFPLNDNFGVYMIKDRLLSAEACYSRAVMAAKAKNRNNQHNQVIQFFNKTMEEQLTKEQRIGREMQVAIDQEQFVVYLQPKYKLPNDEAYGAEALVRWNHPEQGIIYPNDFIPLFESNGFITTLDKYMWEHTCQLLSKWLKAGKKVYPVSVNVSRVSMYSSKMVSFLTGLVKKYGIPEKLLNLELTESAYMDSPEEMQARLKELRAAGFEIMMDDFGSGYSSLNTLREIPVDYIKVDRVFLASIDRDSRSRLVLTSVIDMANRMGIPVITEGVETVEQRDFLADIGCDYIQGFLYAKPMSASDYEKNILVQDIVEVGGHI